MGMVFGRGGNFGFLIGLIFGAYLIVVKFLGLIKLPDTAVFATVDKWILLVAGILIILGGYYFRKDKRY